MIDIERRASSVVTAELPPLGSIGRMVAGLTSLLYDLQLALTPLPRDLRHAQKALARLRLALAKRRMRQPTPPHTPNATPAGGVEQHSSAPPASVASNSGPSEVSTEPVSR